MLLAHAGWQRADLALAERLHAQHRPADPGQPATATSGCLAAGTRRRCSRVSGAGRRARHAVGDELLEPRIEVPHADLASSSGIDAVKPCGACSEAEPSASGRLSVALAAADVVLEQQAADGESRIATTPMMSSQTWTNASPRPATVAGAGDAERPVAARAEEAQLAGRLGDLGVAAVLGTRVDAARHEPEERAGDAEQAAGEDQRGEAGPLDVAVDVGVVQTP